jgi:hypothetical protein
MSFIAGGRAAAGTVTWQISGTVELVSETLIPGQYADGAQAIMDADVAAAGIAVGAPWSARVSFDPDAAGAEIDTGLVQFTTAGTRFEVTLGGYSASSGAGASGDAVVLSGAYGNALALSSPVTRTSSEVFADSAKLLLAALTHGTLPTGSLPVDPPDLQALATIGSTAFRGELNGTHFALLGHVLVPSADIFGGGDVPAGFTINGSISDVERVPEPPAFALAAAALTSLTLRRAFLAALARCRPGALRTAA